MPNARISGRLNLAFGVIAIVGFLIVTVGIDAIVRVRALDFDASTAASAALRGLWANMPGTLLFVLVFLALYVLVVRVAASSGLKFAAAVFVASVAIFALLHADAYSDYHAFLHAEKWTAASLALGFLPFKDGAVLFAVALITERIEKRKRA